MRQKQINGPMEKQQQTHVTENQKNSNQKQRLKENEKTPEEHLINMKQSWNENKTFETCETCHYCKMNNIVEKKRNLMINFSFFFFFFKLSVSVVEGIVFAIDAGVIVGGSNVWAFVEFWCNNLCVENCSQVSNWEIMLVI